MFKYLRAKFRQRAWGKNTIRFDGASLPALLKAVRETHLDGTNVLTGKAIVDQSPRVRYSGVTAKVHIKAELKDVSKKSA